MSASLSPARALVSTPKSQGIIHSEKKRLTDLRSIPLWEERGFRKIALFGRGADLPEKKDGLLMKTGVTH